MRFKLISTGVLASAVFMAGCGTKVSEAQPYGADKFVIYTKSKNLGDAHAKSVESANAFCATKSKTMQPVTSKKVDRRQFEFVFVCK